MTDEVAARFLDALRHRLGEPTLEYAEEPQKLAGGYYTDNRAFRLESTNSEWSIPLVLRLFPRQGLEVQARREGLVQNALVAQGFPVPRVLWFEESRELLGRSFLVMEKLPGRSPLGGSELRAILRSFPFLALRMPKVVARVQADLHALDVDAFVAELKGLPGGVERWLDRLDERVESDTPELAGGLQWLRKHQPIAPRLAICHGDLWAGNLLIERGQVTGVLDWTVATVADPALDVGFAAMSLAIAPVEAGPRMQPLIRRGGQWMSERFVKAYARRTGADLTHQRYYEAMRVVLELVGVIEHRKMTAEGLVRDSPTPTWDCASDRMLDYFDARTGVRMSLPPRVV